MKYKRIEIGEPKPGTDLRATDFAWQAFQAGMSFARHGSAHHGITDIEVAHGQFVAWWNQHPQVQSVSTTHMHVFFSAAGSPPRCGCGAWWPGSKNKP